jgi:20S proteasome alpha/beta subunit
LATEAEYAAAGEATGDHYEEKYGELMNLSVYQRMLAKAK